MENYFKVTYMLYSPKHGHYIVLLNEVLAIKKKLINGLLDILLKLYNKVFYRINNLRTI